MQGSMRLVEGYNPPSRLQPGSLGLTVVISGLFVSGLFFLNPNVARTIETTLVATNIPLDPPPPPPDPKPQQQPKVQPKEKIFVPPVDNHVTPPPDTPKVDTSTISSTPVIPGPPADGAGTVIPDIPKSPPVMVGPAIDPHYAGYFQPPYPADEIRAGNAGRVTVRVLIGTDGRVKDIEKVSAASDSFWDATRRQALSKWRFKPATRDGVPYETWKTMNVSFVLNGDQ